MTKDQKIILVSGYAKLPANITAESIYKTLVLVAEIDRSTGRIIKAECSLVTELARNFIADLLEGSIMEDGIEPLIVEIEDRYRGGACKAIITALKMLFAKYRDTKAEKQ